MRWNQKNVTAKDSRGNGINCVKCGKPIGSKHNQYLHLSKQRTAQPTGDFIRAARAK